MTPEEMLDLLRMEYSKGRYDTITKAVEWLKNNADKYTDTGCGVPFLYIGLMINDFKKAMEQ